MSSQPAIGQRVPRIEGEAKASGSVTYAADVMLPGMLYGKILFSDRPHARIVRFDPSRALAHPDVVAVVSAADAPTRRYGLYIEDQLIFACDRVLYVGQPVAAVAATSERAAAEALDLIEVDYEDLEPVFDPEAALLPGSPQVHPEIEDFVAHYPAIKYGNVGLKARLEQGDAAGAFAAADRIFEETYRTQVAHQAYLEPHACAAGFDYTGRLTVWTGTQQLSVCHAELAAALDIPMTRVKVVPMALGGGFGGKLKTQLEPIAALLARAARRPVKIALTAAEDLATARPRAPYRIKIKTGVMNDGHIVARQVEALGDAGAYADHVVGTAMHLMKFAQGPYHIPNAIAESYVVYTNNGNWGCMRGYGMVELGFAAESHMDTIAHGLGLDPAEFRLKNLCRDGEPILSTQRLRGVSIRKTMQAALDASGYWHKRHAGIPGRGIGIANLIHSTGLLGSSASVRINEDGSASILCAAVDVGTGSHTVLCQIAAQALGLPVDRVGIASLDSDGAPYDLGAIASRTIYDTGNAVRLAADDARGQLMKLAAKVLHCEPGEVVVEDDCYYAAGRPETSVALARLAGMAGGGACEPLIGRGSWLAMPPFDTPVGEGYGEGPVGTFLFGTHVAEVEVDRETGHVRVLNLTAAHDVGRVLNPTGLEGQLQGGAVQGIGFGLYEELMVREGRVLNGSFLDYKLPTSMDVPHINTVFVEEPEPSGPFGARGVGEPPIMGPAPAIANAIHNAVGVRMRELPITPERLYRKLVERDDQ